MNQRHLARMIPASSHSNEFTSLEGCEGAGQSTGDVIDWPPLQVGGVCDLSRSWVVATRVDLT